MGFSSRMRSRIKSYSPGVSLKRLPCGLTKYSIFSSSGQSCKGLVVNGRGEALDLLEVEPLAILLGGDLADGDNLLHGGRLVSDDHVTGLGVQEVLEDAAFVAVLVVERVGLHLSDCDVGEAPDLGVGVEPPVPTIVLATLGLSTEANLGQVDAVKGLCQLVAQPPDETSVLVFARIVANVEHRPPLRVLVVISEYRAARLLDHALGKANPDPLR